MQWYYADGGRQTGPLDDASFRDLVNSGKVRAETLVWRAGMPAWQPYGTVEHTPVALAAGAIAGAGFCAQCGRAFPSDELAAFGSTLVCGDCKPIFAQSLLEGKRLTGVQYGGFWIRVGAALLDAVLLNIVFFIISAFWMGASGINRAADPLKLLALEGWLLLIQLIIGVSYEVFFIGRFGATPGKMTCRLKVVTADGGRLSYAGALGRYFSKAVSGLLVGIGYLMVAFDEEKRGLHDRMCNTRVIRK
jgi:uncharacterized RDD family membrane protein YckC